MRPDITTLAARTSETARDLVSQVMPKHERSVFEVMVELKQQIKDDEALLSRALEALEAALKFAHWQGWSGSNKLLDTVDALTDRLGRDK